MTAHELAKYRTNTDGYDWARLVEEKLVTL